MKTSTKSLTVLVATIGAAIALSSLQPIPVEAQPKIIDIKPEPKPKPPKVKVEIGDITVKDAKTGEVIKKIPREDSVEKTTDSVKRSTKETIKEIEDALRVDPGVERPKNLEKDVLECLFSPEGCPKPPETPPPEKEICGNNKNDDGDEFVKDRDDPDCKGEN